MPKYDYFVAHKFTEQEKDDLRDAIEKAFDGNNLKPYYADKELRESGTHILDKIIEKIQETKFGIFDITGGNPNVCLELGLAKGFSKKFFIICGKDCIDSIPSDLKGLDRIDYRSYKGLTEEIKMKILPEALEMREVSKAAPQDDKLREKIAIQQLRFPLLHHFFLLFNILKACVQVKPNKNYKNVSDLFDDLYFDQITFLDFSKPAPVAPSMDWFNYLAKECLEFKENLNQTLNKYSTILELYMLDLIEEIINSAFIAFILNVRTTREFDKQLGITRTYNFFSVTIDLVKEYTRSFTRLIDYYNQYAPNEKRIIMEDYLWQNNTEPLIGSGRIPPT